MDNIKFTKCVIGTNYTPVGFVFIKDGVETFADFASLCRSNASDGTLYFSDSGVFGLYNNTENAIDICRETVDGGYSAPIDPSLHLTQRVVSGGKVVGFVVKDSTGAEVKKHIASILSASKYMKPANYKVVERGGRQFLQGKGVRLMELPVVDVTPGLTTTKKPKTVRTEPYDVVDPKLTRGVSLANLIKIVKICGGAILKMPEDEYAPVGSMHLKDGIDFTRIKGACEIASPILEASVKKLSASFNYRVLGTLVTSENPAYAYMFRKKNAVNIHHVDGVIRGDKVRLERFGVVIPRANETRFQEAIAGSVTVTPMQSLSAADTATRLLQMKDPVYYAVDLKEISLLGPEYENYLMVGEQIKETVERINRQKYVSTFLRNMIKGMRTKGQSLGPAPLWRYYHSFSPTALSELRDLGVDLATGLYEDRSPKEYTKNTKSINKAQDIEVYYKLKDEIKAPNDPEVVLSMTVADLPTEVQGILSAVVTELNPINRLRLAEEVKKKSDEAQKEAVNALFFHKVAMLQDGHNTVHSHDKDEWTSAPVSSRAQFTRYTHNCGVIMELRQVNLGK